MKRKYLRALSGYLDNLGGIDKESARKYLDEKGINPDVVRERLLRKMEDGKQRLEKRER